MEQAAHEKFASGDSEHRMWLVILTVLAFMAASRSPIDHSGSDPKGTLLTAQAIIESGSARLDDYAAQENSWISSWQTDRFESHEGHIYYRFPMAPSLLCVPFVWMANLHGLDLHKPTTDADVQNTLSALLVALTVLLSYSLSRRFVPPGLALLLTAGFVFGGPLMSTMGTALWNSGFAAVLGLGVVILLSDMEAKRRSSLPLLAMLLVLAVFSRPTMVLPTVLAAVYAWMVRRRALIPFGAWLVGLICLVLLVHRRLYDGFVLAYYHPARLSRAWWYMLALCSVMACATYIVSRRIHRAGRARQRHGNPPTSQHPRAWAWHAYATACIAGLVLMAAALLFLPRVLNRSGLTHTTFLPNQSEVIETVRAVYGVLLSPSRGLLIYSPYLLFTVGGVIVAWSFLRRRPLFWFCAAWLAAHTVIIARPFRWHGGHCFGSRMYLDAFPALMVLTLLVWQGFGSNHRGHRWARKLLVMSVGLSIFINVYQGMFNRSTVIWNRDPDVDTYTCYLLDWRWPHFLASPAQIEDRLIVHERRLAEGDFSAPAMDIPGMRMAAPFEDDGGLD